MGLPFSLEELAPGSQVDLVALLDQMQEIRKESTGQLPVLMDENIWLRIMKFMYSKCHMHLNIKAGLKDLTFIYGVWHPYKFACLHLYRKFYAVFIYLERGQTNAGTQVPAHPKLAWVEKMIAGLWVSGQDLIPEIDKEILRLQTYYTGIQTRKATYASRRINVENAPSTTSREVVHELYASRRIKSTKQIPTRIDNLKQIRLLVTDYCPAIFGVGCMVRSCNWDGRTYGSAIYARTALQWVLCILLRLSPDDAHKVKYIKTFSLALLMWTPWHSATPGCMHSEEGCEALLSKVTRDLRKHPTRTDHDHYFDIFILTKQAKNELLNKKGGLSDAVVQNLRGRLQAFLNSNSLLPHIQWTSEKVCVVGDGFNRKMESPETPFTTLLDRSKVQEELIRSLKSLTSSTPVSRVLAELLRSRFNMTTQEEQAEYMATYALLHPSSRTSRREDVVRQTKRRRIASMYCVI